MKELHVSFASLQDIPGLCILLGQLFSQEEEFCAQTNLQEKALYTILQNPNLGAILVAKIDKKVVGMVNLLFTVSTALGDKVILLEDMVVDKEYRNQKIGSILLTKAIEYTKENNFLRITLLSDDDNERAHHFYKKHGFEYSARKVFTCKDFS